MKFSSIFTLSLLSGAFALDFTDVKDIAYLAKRAKDFITDNKSYYSYGSGYRGSYYGNRNSGYYRKNFQIGDFNGNDSYGSYRKGYGKPLGLRNWGSGCTEGTMFCDYQSGGFWTCAQSRYVYRACGPGTKCQQQGQNNLFCNYA